MVVGFNTNVSYRGRTFHVQTEDSRHNDPQIVTLLFEGGAILHSLKQRYGASDSGVVDSEVHQLMEAQHKAMMEQLQAGDLDSLVGFEDADTATPRLGPGAVEFGSGLVSDRRLDEVIVAHLTSS